MPSYNFIMESLTTGKVPLFGHLGMGWSTQVHRSIGVAWTLNGHLCNAASPMLELETELQHNHELEEQYIVHYISMDWIYLWIPAGNHLNELGIP